MYMRKKALLLSVVLSMCSIPSYSGNPYEKTGETTASGGAEIEYKREAASAEGQLPAEPSAERARFMGRAAQAGVPQKLNPKRMKRQRPKKAESTDVPLIYGNVWMSNSIGNGVYEIPYSSTMSFVQKFDDAYGISGSVLYDGVFYAQCYDRDQDDFYVNGYDWESGDLVYNTEMRESAVSAGMCEWNGELYGLFFDRRAGKYNLGTCTYTDEGPSISKIAALDGGRGWVSFAIDGNGQAWGICGNYDSDEEWIYDARLYKINLSTGETEEIGECGITPYYASNGSASNPLAPSSMSFERTSGRLFWSVGLDAGSCLTEVNTETGEATLIYEYPDNEWISGMYIPAMPGPDSAPMAQDLAVAFPDGSLTGKVTFKIPETDNGGKPASGPLTYKVTLGDKTIGSGTSSYGSSVSVDATVEASGYYDIACVLKNSVGEGPSAKLHAYIGAGVPDAPEVTLTRSDEGVMTVTWEGLTTTVEGGYIDPASVTYDVTRYPDGKVVASGISATTFSETVETPENGMYVCYYTVKGHNSDMVSAEGKSNGIVMGNGWKVPYAYDFNDPYNYQFYTVLDANGDKETWKLLDDHLFLMIPRDAPADDWVVTPPLYLEEGKVYTFSFDTKAMSKASPSRYEVKWGKTATVEGLTETAMRAKTVEDNDYTTYNGRVIPTESGYYYIGVHNISEKFNFYSYLDNFAVTEAEDVPAAPSDLVVEPGEQAALIANISFVTPTTTIRGVPIDGTERIVVQMDGKTVYEVSALKPGVKMSCFAQPEDDGEYTISVRAYVTVDGRELEGDESYQTVYVGIDYPEVPQGLVMTEPEEPGVIHLSWSPVTKDVKGVTLPETKYLAYHYFSNTSSFCTLPMEETSYVWNFIEPGTQEFVQLAVSAVSKRGEGEKSFIYGFAGTPYNGYLESFADGRLTHNMATSKIKSFTPQTPEWVICNDAMIQGLRSSDGDNGYIVLNASYTEEAASLMLGKMDLSGFKEPVFTYYTYNIEGQQNPDDENLIEVYAREFGPGHEYALVSSKKVCDTGALESWNKVVTDLSAYKGKTIEIMINCTTANMALTVLDALRVADKVYKDVGVTLSAPRSAKPGEEITLVATVRNEADVDAGAYTLKFSDKENVVFRSKEFDALTCGASSVVKVPYQVSPLAEESLSFAAEVIYDGDENTDNNLSLPAVVRPIVSRWPEPLDLKGEVKGDGISLRWDAPDLVTIRTEEITDSFEEGQEGETSYGDWTFVDVDGKTLGGVGGLDIPGVEPGVTTGAFVVIDASNPLYTEQFAAYSGSKYIASFFNYEPGQKDDWAISPLLSGEKQQIDFFARSFLNQYPESFEVYWSAGSTEPADFKLIEGAGSATTPMEWTRYTVELPEGAKHFAIRANSNDQFIFLVDEVSYTAGFDYSGLKLKGYNIYRNGVKINDAPVTAAEYLDEAPLAADNRYHVTAVYEEGESKGCDPVLVTATGIESVDADAADAEYFDLNGVRLPSCPDHGVFIRKTGGKIEKVIRK